MKAMWTTYAVPGPLAWVMALLVPPLLTSVGAVPAGHEDILSTAIEKRASIPFLDPIIFIKQNNTASRRVEVYRNNSSPNQGSAEPQGPPPLDSFWIDQGNLYYIKATAAQTNTIEVHRMTQSSGYRTYDVETGTKFALSDASNGIFTVDSGNLYFVKTRNTPSANVEIHYATASSGYKTGADYVTPFKKADAPNGVYLVKGGDLYFIKTKNVASFRVEVYRSTRSSNYTTTDYHATVFKPADAPSGTFGIGLIRNLYFVKTQKTNDTKHVELYASSLSQGYMDLYSYNTTFTLTDAANGVFRF